ncbi:MAG: EF-P lysine aminoacylase EpmA [Alphaproteobacteria bacterium]
MSWWLPHRFEAQKPYLEARAQVLRETRGFFDSQGFTHVETPVLQVTPGLDCHIHGFKTGLKDQLLAPLRDLYLHTSPEFAMKKLLVAGMERIYQICPVFRNGDDSRLHSAEFTLLEWYRTNAGYRDVMEDTTRLLRHVAEALSVKTYQHRGMSANPFLNWNIISVLEAFDKYEKISLGNYLEDADAFREAVQRTGIRTAEKDGWDDLFFRVMAEKIEPHLGIGAPCILYDYPVALGALARRKPEDPRFAERFEVYVCGVELCNGFGELTDAAEQRVRFTAEMAEKQALYGESYPLDEDFLKALEHGMPPSGGNALGLDRLVMLASGAENIEQVLWAGKA